MKLAFISDVHAGNHKRCGGPLEAGLNQRCRHTLAALEGAYNMASSEGCRTMVVCGDLLDSARAEPQVLAEVQNIMADNLARGLPTIVLMGNHEMVTDAPGDNSLGPLAPVARVVDGVEVVKLDGVELWAVPFRPGRAAEWLPTVLAEVQGAPSARSPASVKRVLALHLGLQDGETPPWLQDAHDSIHVERLAALCKQHGIAWCFAGNWHEPRMWHINEVGLVQCGALAPTGWGNPGLGYGRLRILDTEKGLSECDITGPRFLTTLDEVNRAGHNYVYARLSAADAAALRLQGGRDASLFTHVEIEEDTAEAQVALRAAAGQARSAESVDGAVATYVAQMPLEDDTLRPEVEARVKRLLGGAG